MAAEPYMPSTVASSLMPTLPPVTPPQAVILLHHLPLMIVLDSESSFCLCGSLQRLFFLFPFSPMEGMYMEGIMMSLTLALAGQPPPAFRVADRLPSLIDHPFIVLPETKSKLFEIRFESASVAFGSPQNRDGHGILVICREAPGPGSYN
jgi:hypothetical protein